MLAKAHCSSGFRFVLLTVLILGLPGLEPAEAVSLRPPGTGPDGFDVPVTAAASIDAYTEDSGGFVALGGEIDFTIRVTNQGSLGTDTYDLTHDSSWPVTFYDSDGITPLRDTDGDGRIDTGPLLSGASPAIIARFHTPAGAQAGSTNFPHIRFTSSLDGSQAATVEPFMSIAAGFAQIYQDVYPSALVFMTASINGTNVSKVIPNPGDGIAMTRLVDGNYFYAWEKSYRVTTGYYADDVEYGSLDLDGNVVLPTTKLTDNSSAALRVNDSGPAVAAAPNGTVGIVWSRIASDSSTGQWSQNIYFATLDRSGSLLTGPTNITNFALRSPLEAPEVSAPTIAASDDNRFIIAWQLNVEPRSSAHPYKLWYAVRNTAGNSLWPPTPLTNSTVNKETNPVLNSLMGGRVIVTWLTGVELFNTAMGLHYAVISSNGILSRPATPLTYYSAGNYYHAAVAHDAVQLSNGKVAVASLKYPGVQFLILNSAYTLQSGPHWAESPSHTDNGGLSLTTDTSSRVIMNWWIADQYSHENLVYALGDSTGSFITSPMSYNSKSSGGFSVYEQGTAPYQGNPVISGNAGVAGATLRYTGGSTTADGSGRYSFHVPRGWSGTVTPSKSGYVFTPAQRIYNNIPGHQNGQNYTAKLFHSVSGNIGVEGGVLYGAPQVVASQANGDYSLSVPNNWSGQISPRHLCFWFDPPNRDYASVTSSQVLQNYTPTLIPGSGCADINISIGGASQGRFGLQSQGSTRVSLEGVNNGTVKIQSTNNVPIIGAERVIYKVNGANTSFSEMTGLPDSQLDTIYWLPWYNNAGASGLDTQLRFANATNATATIRIFIGGTEMTLPGGITLSAGESTRVSYAGVNDGPVKIVSSQKIVAAERVIYKINHANTSFSEMMALPNGQLDNTYWLPWYNNVDLDTQLRIANVTDQPATVTVTIGGVPQEPVELAAGESRRVSYAGVNNGPVKIVSSRNIIAAERVIYKINNINTSFSEMIALPAKQLDMTYWLPWYNNVDLDTQLRIANTTDQPALTSIYIGGVEMEGSPITLGANESTRQSFPGINSGPVRIVSYVPLVVAERVIYKINNIPTSFSEMMGLPDTLLDLTYWLPWYNNIDLDTQLRFGMP